jgi:tetratricopeptide (TPR) repeat protein
MAIQLDPAYAFAYHNRGEVWKDKGDFDRAIADYGKAIGFDPGTRPPTPTERSHTSASATSHGPKKIRAASHRRRPPDITAAPGNGGGLSPPARGRKSLARNHKEDGDRCPSMHVIFVRTVLPFRLGPATSRRHFSLETEDHPLPVNTRKPGYLAIFDTTPDGSLSMSSATGGAPDAARVWPERPRLIPDPHNPYEGFAIRIAQPRGKGVIVAGVE